MLWMEEYICDCEDKIPYILAEVDKKKKMVVEFSVPFYFLWGFFPLIFYTYPFSTCTLSILIWDMISFVNFELLYYKSIN